MSFTEGASTGLCSLRFYDQTSRAGRSYLVVAHLDVSTERVLEQVARWMGKAPQALRFHTPDLYRVHLLSPWFTLREIFSDFGKPGELESGPTFCGSEAVAIPSLDLSVDVEQGDSGNGSARSSDGGDQPACPSPKG